MQTKTSSDENVSRLGTKIAGHDIYWMPKGGGGPCVHLSRSNVKRAGGLTLRSGLAVLPGRGATAWERDRWRGAAAHVYSSEGSWNRKGGACGCASPVSRTAAGKASWPLASWRPGGTAATRTAQLETH